MSCGSRRGKLKNPSLQGAPEVDAQARKHERKRSRPRSGAPSPRKPQQNVGNDDWPSLSDGQSHLTPTVSISVSASAYTDAHHFNRRQDDTVSQFDTAHVGDHSRVRSGREVKFLRRVVDMTQVKFAEAMELTPESVSRWENDARGVGAAGEKLVRHNICALLYKNAKGRPLPSSWIQTSRSGSR
jgi:DNA-binding transcriptional regulator YiaG